MCWLDRLSKHVTVVGKVSERMGQTVWFSHDENSRITLQHRTPFPGEPRGSHNMCMLEFKKKKKNNNHHQLHLKQSGLSSPHVHVVLTLLGSVPFLNIISTKRNYRSFDVACRDSHPAITCRKEQFGLISRR